MPNSLRCKIKKLNHKGLLSDKDRDRLISALDTEDKSANCVDCLYKTEWDKFGVKVNEILDKANESPESAGVVEDKDYTLWVSVKDRLPTKAEYNACNGLFIVTDGDRSYSAYFAVSKQVFGEPTMEGFRVDRNVIAWMPLPKPLSDIDNGSTTEFEESRYRSVDQTGETFDAGEAWRCEKCGHSWKKDWTLRFKFCPACGRRIIKFKS